jgi:hypothetical protein
LLTIWVAFAWSLDGASFCHGHGLASGYDAACYVFI